MKKNIGYISFIILFSSLMIFIVCGVEQDATAEPQLINEVCTGNFNVLQDENGKYSDYVELWNSTDEELPLEGFYLSDDKDKLDKYSLEDITLAPNQYYVLFLDGSSDQDADKEGFKLSKKGDKLFLYDKAEKRVCQMISIPAITYNKVYARKQTDDEEKTIIDAVMEAGNWKSENGGNGQVNWTMMDATPGESNAGAREYPLVKLAEPEFSKDSGFYDDSFELKLVAGLGEQIYFTLDGSDPDVENSQQEYNSTQLAGTFRYEKPIRIEDASAHENVYSMRTDLSPTRDDVPDYLVDKATIIKAVAYNARENTCSPVVTKSYFVGFAEKTLYKDMAVMSLAVDPVYLFDPDTGIYTNGKALERYRENGGFQNDELLGGYEDEAGNYWNLYEASNAFYTGKEWEREGTITYFDEKHKKQFTQNVGLRIAGASTRGTPQKSFKLYGRSVYDKQVQFPYEFFENASYSSVKIRNGGSNNGSMKMLDAFVESLVEDRDVAIQRARPVVLFLNGEYWGLYNIRERYTAEYVHNYYGVSAENVWIIDAGTSQEGGQEALDAYNMLKEFVEQNDMSVSENYRTLAEQFDMNSLIDFLSINYYLKNEDIDFNQNMALWRTIEPEEGAYGDCKWRMMFFDADECLNDYDPEESTGNLADLYLFQTPFVQSLFRNDEFREFFKKTVLELMEQNFDYDKVYPELMRWQERYRTQTLETSRRFFSEEYSAERYDSKVKRMDTFFQERRDFVLQDLQTLP